LRLTVGSKSTTYHVAHIPCDFGQAGLCLTKIDGPDVFASHDVLLDGQDSICARMGFLAHHHCKHVDACLKLHAEGRLPGGNQTPQPPRSQPRPQPKPLNPLDTCLCCRQGEIPTDDGMCARCGDMAADRHALLADHPNDL
jgi:hypothetical protein